MIDTYYPVGNRLSRNTNGSPITWAHDAADRMIAQSATATMAYGTFSYDAVGNMLVKWHQDQGPLTMSYDATNRLTTSIQGAVITTFTFDRSGNHQIQNVNGVVTTFSYDNENRLLNVQATAGNSTYTYQGDGLRRSAQELGQALTTFVWDESNYLQGRN